ncbi:hypothetical protein CONLIGDRAFT_679642 [Coniochaeta ligniaria NRRL 30616]|uniref:Mitochondrial escape protein 2 n=1 Tax=Coniochaeta ligniaria NRRL 30616 TaxID=1408157 RepID=A0A1J7JC50_9PEZI|nr:hypothetical protein CONLIGDRAFT_679642 [Coniochaeta ligniaria NRRL 30616]
METPTASPSVTLPPIPPLVGEASRRHGPRSNPVSGLGPSTCPTVGTGSVELSQETLYDLFRKYGKIVEITSQPQDSAILPKFAHNDFVFLRDSIVARNCLHGFTVRETTQKPLSTVTNSIFAPPFPRQGKLSHLNVSSAGL